MRLVKGQNLGFWNSNKCSLSDKHTKDTQQICLRHVSKKKESFQNSIFTVRIIFKLLVVFGLLEFQCYVHKLVLSKEHLFRLLKHLFANPMLFCDVRKPTSARQVILSSPMMDDIFAWFLGPLFPL